MGRLGLRDGGAFVCEGDAEPAPLGTSAQLRRTKNQVMVVLTLSERLLFVFLSSWYL